MYPSTALQQTERRSLRVGQGANLLMTASGIMAALLSGADAPLLDGLYSGVNFISTFIAAQVGENVMRPSNPDRPFGYYADEAIYITFRSISILGMICFAGLAALTKIVDFLEGKSLPRINFSILLVYGVAMMVICFSLAYVHHRNWQQSGRQSDILKTETHAAITDGVLSAGLGIAFGLAPLIAQTPLQVILPILDAIIVLILVSCMVSQPLKTFLNALGEIAGKGAESQLIETLKIELQPLAASQDVEILEIALTKLGRFHLGIIYLRPTAPLAAVRMDQMRADIMAVCSSVVGLIEIELVLTNTPRLSNRGSNIEIKAGGNPS